MALKTKDILQLVIGIIILYYTLKMINKYMGKEGYSASSNMLMYDAINHYRPLNLYQEDKGLIGKRKMFSHMRKPYLNPILKPVIQNITE